jgi:magnesium and cobalt transporter
MKEGRSSNGSDGKSWLDKISQVFGGEPKDREELVELLRDAQHRNLLGDDALAMIEGVLQVSEMQVRDIMIPRSQMVVVDREHAPEEFLPLIIESGHSRFPVIGDGRDEVEGILLAKDLLSYFGRKDGEVFDIRDVMRRPAVIPESKRLNVLLKEFRAKRNHMAIVVDEYGGVAGLVTIEDVLEQIVGEIEDEYDVEEDSYIMKYDDSTFSLKALTPIEDFNEYFSTNFSDEEFDTVGGLVLNRFGHLPSRGEQVEVDDFRFEVIRADNRRVHLLQLTKVGASQRSSVAETNSEH